jgi:hypothetical protein
MTADYPDWLPPAQQMLEAYFGVTNQLAALIATGNPNGAPGGVPLLAQPEQIYFSNTVIPLAAGVQGQVIDDVNGQALHAMSAFLSYEIRVVPEGFNVAGTPFLTFFLSWYGDNTTNYKLYEECWTVPSAQFGNQAIVGTGPVRGAYLQVTVCNEDSVNAQGVSQFIIYGNSRPCPVAQSDWLTLIPTSPVSTYAVPAGGTGSDGCLGTFTHLQPVSSNTAFIFGLYNGLVEMTVEMAGTSTNFSITPLAFLHGIGLTEVDNAFAFTGPFTVSTTLLAPRSPLILKLANADAAHTITFTGAIIAQPRGS